MALDLLPTRPRSLLASPPFQQFALRQIRDVKKPWRSNQAPPVLFDRLAACATRTFYYASSQLLSTHLCTLLTGPLP
eukprot:1111524-Pleurochrysis_carterae.AAC.1